MKSLGKKPQGARLERIQASPRWAGEGFRNVHPIIPGLRDPNASDADAERVSLRRRTARAARAAAVDESARSVDASRPAAGCAPPGSAIRRC